MNGQLNQGVLGRDRLQLTPCDPGFRMKMVKK